MKDRTVHLVRLSYVPRWAVLPMMRPQSVAEHSFRVAAIAFDLAEHCHDLDWGAKYRIATLALMHDADEALTGDIPSPLKAAIHVTKPKSEFPDIYHHIVKLADCVEALTYYQMFRVPTDRSEAVMRGLVQNVMQAGGFVPGTVFARAEALITYILNDQEGDIDGENKDEHPKGKAGQFGTGIGGRPDHRRGFGNSGGSILRAVHPDPGDGGGDPAGPVLPERRGPRPGLQPPHGDSAPGKGDATE